jgi:Pyruvate/2-oxoacid:ferredoxin oxidoreductase gamma subunit
LNTGRSGGQPAAAILDLNVGMDWNGTGIILEFELYIAGIGGQGVQLIAKTLALATLAEGRFAMLTGEYGSLMRGGSSLATVVLGNAPLRALPVIPQARAALVLHHMYWEAPRQRLRNGALVAIDEAIAAHLPPMPAQVIVRIPATQIATRSGAPMAAGMALLGGFSALTGLIGIDSLVEAMKKIVPPYRRQHLETNEKALRGGADSVQAGAMPIDLDRDLLSRSA